MAKKEDKERKAKPKGYRFTGDNNKRPLVSERGDSDVYFEGRKDRSDKNLTKKLAKGGYDGSWSVTFYTEEGGYKKLTVAQLRNESAKDYKEAFEKAEEMAKNSDKYKEQYKQWIEGGRKASIHHQGRDWGYNDKVKDGFNEYDVPSDYAKGGKTKEYYDAESLARGIPARKRERKHEEGGKISESDYNAETIARGHKRISELESEKEELESEKDECESDKQQYEDALYEVKSALPAGFKQGGNIDKDIKAKPKGYRFVGDNYKRPLVSERGDSDVYFEARKNRSDKNLTKKLAKGGNLEHKIDEKVLTIADEANQYEDMQDDVQWLRDWYYGAQSEGATWEHAYTIADKLENHEKINSDKSYAKELRELINKWAIANQLINQEETIGGVSDYKYKVSYDRVDGGGGLVLARTEEEVEEIKKKLSGRGHKNFEVDEHFAKGGVVGKGFFDVLNETRSFTELFK